MLEVALILLAVVLFIAGLAAIAIVMDRWDDRKTYLGPTVDPHDVLDMRLANGEINEAEYLRLKHLLTSGPVVQLPDERRFPPTGPIAR